MTVLAWPTGLESRPIVGSQQVAQTTEAPLVSEMNSGTTRARRKYTIRIAKISFTLFLKNADVATFKTFHETTLGDGSARFTMPILFAGAYVTRTCRFAASPSYQETGDHTKVGVSLLVENL